MERPPSAVRRSNTPSVTLVVPVFERVEFLGAALRSVRAQSRPPDELVVVIDGPAIPASRLVRELIGPVRVVRRPHGGPGAARNTGVAIGRGDVIAFLDSDDLWLPTKLERQLEVLERDPAVDVVFGGVEQFFSPELRRTGEPVGSERAERAGVLPSTTVVRASAFRRVGGFREGVLFGEMLDWYGRAVDAGLGMSTIDAVVVRRRVHGHNAGVRFRDARGSYATMAKALLDRRRQTLVRQADEEGEHFVAPGDPAPSHA